MIVKDFVQGYLNLKKPELKEDFCKQHLKRTYAPIIEKNAMLKRLTQACAMKTDNGILYLDMVCNKMNLTHAIICLYTDLELADPKAEESKHEIIDNYDAFQEHDILNVFCKLIGEREINELLLVNQGAIDTWHEEHSSTRAFVSDMTDKAVRTFVEMAALMKEVVTPEDQEKFGETIKQFIGVSNGE